MQRVEGVKELFLGALFLSEELDVVDQQDVDIAELVAKAGHLVVAQRVDHLVGELLAGDVADGSLRKALFYFMPNSLHQVGFAHSDATVEEEWVVGLGWPLRYGLAGGVGKLVAAADDEGVEGVARIQLRGAVPIEAGLGGRGRGTTRSGSGGRDHGKAAIVAEWSGGRVVFGCDELDVGILEAKIIDGFLNQVGILVAYVAELDGGNAHEEHATGRMAIAGGLQPGVVGVPVDLFLEGVEDANPRIRGKRCTWNGHKGSSRGRRLVRARLLKILDSLN